jgi:PAS domain-containing protein
VRISIRLLLLLVILAWLVPVQLIPVMQRDTVILFTTLVLLGIVALVWHWGITRPLARLRACAQAFGQGAAAPPIDPGGPTEICELADTFTAMATALQAERASLRESEESLRALLDASPEMVFLMEPDGTVVAANDTCALRLHTTREALLGACIYDFLPPVVAENRRQAVAEVMRTGHPWSWVDLHPGNTLESYLVPVHNAEGHIVRLAVFGRDITE